MGNKKQLPDRLIGLSKKDIAAHIAEIDSAPEALSIPLPGPLGAAFAGAGRNVCGMMVRYPVLMDFSILQQLDSPLLRQMAEAAKPKKLRRPTPFNDQDGWNMVYQFTTPIEEVEAALAKGKANFEKLAKKKAAYSMNPFAFNMIVKIIGKQLAESYLTALKYHDPKEADSKDFPEPSAELKTGSAGG